MPEVDAGTEHPPLDSAGGPVSASTPSPRRRLTVALAGLVILALAFGVVWLQSSKYEPLTLGMMAPDFSLPDMEGKVRRLSDYRGKVVFLNFWATWCKPCKEEMPSMEILWENFKSEEFVMLAISMDRVTTKKDIPSFIESMKLTFPILTDSWGQTDKLYKLMGVPETYIIDQNGVLREKVIGPRDWTEKASLATIVQLVHKQAKSVEAK